MTYFFELFKRLLRCEDDRGPYNRLPKNLTSQAHHRTYHRNPSPSLNPSPTSYKAPSTPSSSSKLPKSSPKPKQPSSLDPPYSPFPKPPTSSSSPKPPTSSYKPQQSSSFNASSVTSKLPTPLSALEHHHQLLASPKPRTSSSSPNPRTISSPVASPKPHPSSPKPPPSSKPFALSSEPPVSSTKVPPIFKSVLSPVSSNVRNQKGKTKYERVQTDPLPLFAIPEDIKDLIKKDIVPKVLNQPLSPATYKDHFAALLYAEEFYQEKWPHFDLENKTLELEEASVCKNLGTEEKTFVKLKIDSDPENRPFLLSRDLVYVRPTGMKVEAHFQGFIHRIVKSSLILVEFEDDFYYYHDSTQKYDVSFSFNRVCLKRAHQAIQTASEDLLSNFIFPEFVSRASIPTSPSLLPPRYELDPLQLSAVRRILSIQGSPPYLVAGRSTRVVVSEAVHQLYRTSLENRILICAPSNRACDGIMRSLLKVIPESEMFRANAAFREKDEVPEDILPSCRYEDPYFSCPPTKELREFRVIFSTFMSSYRLHPGNLPRLKNRYDKGLAAGHFSHIFMVDSSSALEPETAVTLTNFGDKNTTVVVTGKPGEHAYWVRSDMARKKGLKISYFERLWKSKPYKTLNPLLITQLDLGSSNSLRF